MAFVREKNLEGYFKKTVEKNPAREALNFEKKEK